MWGGRRLSVCLSRIFIVFCLSSLILIMHILSPCNRRLKCDFQSRIFTHSELHYVNAVIHRNCGWERRGRILDVVLISWVPEEGKSSQVPLTRSMGMENELSGFHKVTTPVKEHVYIQLSACFRRWLTPGWPWFWAGTSLNLSRAPAVAPPICHEWDINTYVVFIS